LDNSCCTFDQRSTLRKVDYQIWFCADFFYGGILNFFDTLIDWKYFNQLNGLRKGFWAILDQGVLALGSFILHVFVARYLTQSEYGFFILFFSVFLLLAALHTAFITEPMLVFGGGKFIDKFGSYFNRLLFFHLCLGIVGFFLFVFLFVLIRKFNLISNPFIIFSLGFGTPLILFNFLVRKAFYAKQKPFWSLIGSLIHFAVLIIGLWVLKEGERINPENIFYLLGVSGMVAGLPFLVFFRKENTLRIKNKPTGIVSTHWKYGKWAFLTTVTNWLPWNLNFILLSFFSLSLVGSVRVLLNFLLPVSTLLMALSGIYLPMVSRTFYKGDFYKFRKVILNFFSIYIFLSIIYCIFLFLFGGSIFDWLYSGKYSNFRNLVPFFGLIQIPLAPVMVMGLVFRGLGRSDFGLRNYLPYGLLAVVLGTIGAFFYREIGLLVGFLVASTLGFLISLQNFVNIFGKEDEYSPFFRRAN